MRSPAYHSVRAGRTITITRVETSGGVEWEIDMNADEPTFPVVVARSFAEARRFVTLVGAL